jgi:hypothetical protein
VAPSTDDGSPEVTAPAPAPGEERGPGAGIAPGTAIDLRSSGSTSDQGLANATSDAIRHIVDVLRGSVEQEFRSAERLSTTARQTFAVAAAFVAIAQSFAFGSFRAQQVTHAGRLALVISAAAAIALLIVAGVATVRVDKDDDKPERDVNPEYLTESVARLKQGTANADVVADLANAYRQVLESRQRANRQRSRARRTARRWVVAALLLTVVELGVALYVRI